MKIKAQMGRAHLRTWPSFFTSVIETT